MYNLYQTIEAHINYQTNPIFNISLLRLREAYIHLNNFKIHKNDNSGLYQS